MHYELSHCVTILHTEEHQIEPNNMLHKHCIIYLVTCTVLFLSFIYFTYPFKRKVKSKGKHYGLHLHYVKYPRKQKSLLKVTISNY